MKDVYNNYAISRLQSNLEELLSQMMVCNSSNGYRHHSLMMKKLFICKQYKNCKQYKPIARVPA